MEQHPLDTPETLKAQDPDGMLERVAALPDQMREAFLMDADGSVPSDVRGIVFCGMGGSALGGDLIRAWAEKTNLLPCTVHRGYGLPGWVDGKTLVITTSYSGNTEETLDAYYEAKTRRCPTLVVSSGGKLLDNARSRGDAYVSLPEGMPPRAALAYLTFPVIRALTKAGLLESADEDFEEAVRIAGKCRDSYNADIPFNENPPKRIAGALVDKVALIYSGHGLLAPVAYRWRCQLQENGKSPAVHNTIPEMNHNEIASWNESNEAITKQCHVFLLKDSGDHAQVKKRFDMTKALLEPHASAVTEINSGGKGRLARLFSLIVLGDFVSVYAGILRGEDPSKIASIERLKEMLAGPVAAG